MADTVDALMRTPPSESEADFACETQALLDAAAERLNLSNVFTFAGFETLNDKILLEMNERAKQLLKTETETKSKQDQQQQKANKEREDAKTTSQESLLMSPLQEYARINRSPPETRFSAAHNRQFAQSAPITSSPFSKRVSSGEESPSKRMKARGGHSIGIATTPTKSLGDLTLDNKERLESISAARQRQKQMRDLQTSPRRRMQHPPSTRTRPASTSDHSAAFKLNLPPPRSVSLDAKANADPRKPTVHRKLPAEPLQPVNRRPISSVPRSRSMKITPQPPTTTTTTTTTSTNASKPNHIPRSASAKHVNAASLTSIDQPRSRNLLPPFPDNLPSYARPTQAALRRSQSINHTLNGVDGKRK